MISWLLKKAADPLADQSVQALMTTQYADNPLVILSAATKVGLFPLVEAGMRAASGEPVVRPLGSPRVLSPWHKILLTPKQLFELPTVSVTEICARTIIGPHAKKPLVLGMPVMITGMSYGGSLSMNLKVALAKGASMAGTATNTGESTVTGEERGAAKLLIGQYNRGGWLTSHDQLSRLDAIEVQMGQGAWGGAAQSAIKASTMGDELKKAFHAADGQDASIRSRMSGVDSPRDLIGLVKNLKETYEVPVGIKIAGSDNIELELEIVSKAGADFITIDGSEGGTAKSPATLEDDVGMPTFYAVVRAADWLKANGLQDKCSLVVAGGLSTPGHFLKALALGANAVAIGTIAIVAALHDQLDKTVPQGTMLQLALYDGKQAQKLDVEKASVGVANFLRSCLAEMKLAAQTLGKTALSQICRDDIVATEKDLAEFARIRYAGSHGPKRG